MNTILNGSTRRSTFTILALAIVPALVIILHSGMERNKEAVRIAQDKAAQQVTNIGDQITMLVENTRVMLRSLSNLHEIRNVESEVVAPLFASLMSQQQAYSNIFLLSPEGKTLSSGRSTLPLLLQDDINLVKEAVNKRRFSMGNTLLRPDQEGPTMLAVQPIFGFKGEVTALIGVFISLDNALEQFQYAFGVTDAGAAKMEEVFALRLVDRTEHLAFAINSPDNIQPGSLLPLDETLLFLTSQENNGTYNFNFNGVAQLVAYDRLVLSESAEPYLSVLLNVPSTAIYKKAQEQLTRDIVLLGVASMLSIFIGVLVASKTIVAPLERLLRMAQSIRQGDYSVRLSKPGELEQSSTNEITILAKTFDVMAEHLDARTRDLNKAQQNAVEAAKTKSEFLANMSHEIRTPMNAIIGMAYLALKTNLSSRQANYVQKIYGAGTALLSIINDILDLSKIEAGKMNVENVPFNIQEVLHVSTTESAEKAHEKGLHFNCRISPSVPINLIGDPTRLQQVIGNLSLNAVKYTDSGHVEVRCRLVEKIEDVALVLLEVSDSGIGMPEEAKKFFLNNHDTEAHSEQGGIKLGLAVTKRLIALMGGKAIIESAPGKGTTIKIWISLGIATASRALSEEDSFQGVKALVVSQYPEETRLLRTSLRKTGLDYTITNSIEEAQSILGESVDSSNNFRVVFISSTLDGGNYNDAVVRLRVGRPEHAQPYFVLTVCNPELHSSWDDGGTNIDGYFYSPFESKSLHNLLYNLLELVNSTYREINYDSTPEAVATSSEEELTGVRVLLVEDNMINQQVAQDLLLNVGATVDVAANGQISLDMLVSQKEDDYYDLVLMDVQMPVMDGYEATKLIRQQKRFDSLPVIAMTAHSLSEEQKKLAAVGMDDYISKPISVQTLYGVIHKWADKRKKSQLKKHGRESIQACYLPDDAYKTLSVIADLLHFEDPLAVDVIDYFKQDMFCLNINRLPQLKKAIQERDFLQALDLLSKDGIYPTKNQDSALSVSELAQEAMAEPTEVAKEPFEAQFARLLQLLRDSDVESLYVFDELMPELTQRMPRAYLEAAKKNLSLFEFQRALFLLENPQESSEAN